MNEREKIVRYWRRAKELESISFFKCGGVLGISGWC
ncbi:MAG: hypothetical protein PWQ20_1612 [Thermotogaceae bacterium]|jgi:hypothetical protein|nr:hypothetical protein [Thermotogaceae bacterium]